MGNTARGKHALFISDRSGLAYPYTEMVKEWNGSRVHTSEYEPKQPQLEPKPYTADPQGLMHPRPQQAPIPTPDFLPNNPFKLLSLQAKIEVSHPNSGIQVGDQVRLTSTAAIPYTNLVGTPGTMSIQDIELSTTLAADITASDTTLTLTDFLSATLGGGFLMIQKINSTTGLFENEVIQYTSHNNLLKSYSGLTRGTNVPFRGVTPANTTASAHSAGAKVFISREVSSLNSTNGYVLNSQTTALVDSQRSGGENCTAGPLNDKG
jgi:hypothetical protein